MASSSEVKAYLKYAELANAAYAFEELYSNDKKYKGLSNQEKMIKILDETRAFSANQAQQFVTQYKYNFSYTDSNNKTQKVKTSYEFFNGSPSGFKATLLKGSGNEYILTIAGTDPDVGDIGADLNLVGGKLASQFTYLVDYVTYLKTQILPEGAKMTVTGHSLGGALAQMTAATFPELVSKAYTYNSPGAKGLSIPALDMVDGKYYTISEGVTPIYHKISKELYDAYTSYAHNNATVSNVINVRGLAEYGTGITDLGTDIGSSDTAFFINTEVAAFNTYAHGIGTLEKSLYFYNTLMTIDPSLNSQTITNALDLLDKSEQNVPAQGLDYFDRWLAKINTLFDNAITYKANQQDGRSIADFYIAFQKEEYASYKNLSFDFLTDDLAETIASNAKTNTATLYALVNLNPFTIQGDLQAYKTLKADDYSQTYLEKRSQMLYYTIRPESANTGNGVYYQDDSTGAHTQDKLMVNYANGSSSFVEFGTEKKDDLVGFDNDDFLFGGAGDDTLIGGLEGGVDDGIGDHLEGGKDFDTYIAGDGDTIYDSDGKGKVEFENIELKGAVWNSLIGEYESISGKTETYSLEDDELSIAYEDKKLTIKDFSKEDKSLGIDLNGYVSFKIEDTIFMEEDSNHTEKIIFEEIIVLDDKTTMSHKALNDETYTFTVDGKTILTCKDLKQMEFFFAGAKHNCYSSKQPNLYM